MKKNFYQIFAIALVAFFAFSCNSDKSTTKTLELSSVSVMGTDKKYIEIVPGSYELSFAKKPNVKDSYLTSVVLNVKLIKKVGTLKNKEAKYGDIKLALLDSSSQRVDIDPLSPVDGGWARLEELLRSEVGTEMKIKFAPFGLSVRGDKLAEFEKIEELGIENADFSVIYEASEPAPAVSSSSRKSSGSGNWTTLLNKYEKYIDSYISCMKKANNGDMTAMVDAMSMLEQATELYEELKQAQGEMSASDVKRLTAIYSKMANAAMSF
ncbi:MAG: hypothetical protein R3Y38_07830 [Rikenellaceae bacterium]